ncbi:MAG: isoleucine--tRNA ligase, partial [bacterium]
MNYQDTLNLPKTEFKMKADLPKREPDILKSWQELNIYNTLRQERKDNPKYVLHDGPPYANGDIHMGHALNKILKDIIVKYKSMKGFDAPYVPGWDCHGLPIEYKVVAETKDSDKLTKMEIRKICRDYAIYFAGVQKEEFKRLGILGDWERPYLTLTNDYSAAVIEVFKELVEKGYIYKSKKPVYWCAPCGTALAEAEVEYKEVSSPSIFVKFPIKPTPKWEEFQSKIQNPSILIWTTTPWTLLANVAIALNPQFEYSLIKVEGENLIMARELIESTLTAAGKKDYEELATFRGDELEGIVCQHPFIERDSLVILGSHVTREQGTGCVHTAPGHGLDDYEVGFKYNLPVIAPVDSNGKFTNEGDEFAGLNVFSANKHIIEKIHSLGKLFHQETITHSYPHCWRCKHKIIFRATDQWFIRLENDELRQKTLKAIEDVTWVPAWGEERFYNTVNLRADWCISRQRAWGVPIPAFYCTNCQQTLLDSNIIEMIKNQIREQGIDIWFEKDADSFLPEGIKCKECGGNKFRKEEDIIDVWFESGVSHRAVLKKRQELIFPADLYLEGSDQHRGWFQSSILTSMATEKIPPYKAVLTHGFMLDEEGKAMSKSMGNVISPLNIIDKYGADILRLWVISEDYRGDVRLGQEILTRMGESYRKIRNTFRFMLGNLYDFNPSKDKIAYPDLMRIDKWVCHQLTLLIQKVTDAYEKFEFHLIYHLILNFCSSFLSALYLDILKDRLYTFAADSKERRSAQTVMYEITTSLTKLLAPVLSFTSEEIWQNLIIEDKKTSVHLTLFPTPNLKYLDETTAKQWEEVLDVREKLSKALEEARASALIGSSLEAQVILTYPPEKENLLREYEDELRFIFIVSYVELIKGDELKVEVKKAKGSKCSRCWNYSEAVGSFTAHPTLCERCIKVVSHG